MADGCIEILFGYKNSLDFIADGNVVERSFRSGIHGQTQNFRRFIVGGDFSFFGAYIYPFSIPILFSQPCTEFTNRTLDIESILGKDGKLLEERMMLTENNLERVYILSEFFKKGIANYLSLQNNLLSSVRYIIQTKGQKRVREVADLFDVSPRQFERRFKELTGMNPKLFSRITRFQTTLDLYGKKSMTLSDIAYECGYYDQSHFINEFKEFSGYHPGAYFSGQATEATAWKDRKILSCEE